MKQKLLKTLALALLFVAGANSIQAKIVWPTAQRHDRTNNVPESATNWNSGYPKDIASAGSVEINGSAKIWVVMEYNVPNIANVKQITLPFAYNGSNKADIKVYAFPYEIPAVSSTWESTYVSNVASVLSGGTLLATITSGSTSATFSDITLSTLKECFTTESDGSMNIKLLLWTDTRADIYGATTALPSRRPHMEVSYTGVSVVKIGETPYASLSEAYNSATDGAEISLYDDCLLTSRLTFTENKNVTFKAAEGKDVVIYKWRDNITTILANRACTYTFDGSAIGASLTIDDQSTSGLMVQPENGAKFVFKNVTLRNSSVENTLNTTNGYFQFENVTFDNCNATNAIINNNQGRDDRILLKGTLNFTNCEANTYIYTQRRIKILDADFSTTTGPITINTNRPAGNLLLNCKNESGTGLYTLAGTIMDNGWFTLINDDLALMRRPSGDTFEICTVQAYTLNVSDAGAATLVLPFESTIPAGVSCYTLTHTSGNSYVNAKKQETTLSANTPVLVNADEGSYKFVCTSIAAAVSGTEDQTVGALTGVYSDKTFGTEITSYDNIYILNNHSTYGIGFYKAVADLKVGANRCYLTAASVPAEVRGLSIMLDEETGITEVTEKTEVTEGYYDLSGRRVAKPTKGLYIVNGKKIVIK